MANSRTVKIIEFSSPIWQAVLTNDVASLQKHLNDFSPDLIAPIKEDGCIYRSLLVQAAYLGHQAIFSILLPLSDPGDIVDAYTMALEGTKTEIINLLQVKKYVTITNVFGETLLHRAVHQNVIDSVRALLALGADPNTPSSNNEYPLETACAINTCDSKYPSGKAFEVIKLLLDHGATPIPKRDVTSATPLSWCAYHKAYDALTLILSKVDKHSKHYQAILFQLTFETTMTLAKLETFIKLGFSLNFANEDNDSFFKAVANSRFFHAIGNTSPQSWKETLELYELFLQGDTAMLSAQETTGILEILKRTHALYELNTDELQNRFEAISQKLQALSKEKILPSLTKTIQIAGGSPVFSIGMYPSDKEQPTSSLRMNS